MSPNTPEDFKAHLHGAHVNRAGTERLVERGDEVWNALYGYYCGSVEAFYYPNLQGSLPPAGEALFRDLGLL